MKLLLALGIVIGLAHLCPGAQKRKRLKINGTTYEITRLDGPNHFMFRVVGGKSFAELDGTGGIVSSGGTSGELQKLLADLPEIVRRDPFPLQRFEWLSNVATLFPGTLLD